MAYSETQLTGIQVAKYVTTGQGNQLLKPDTQPWTDDDTTYTNDKLHALLVSIDGKLDQLLEAHEPPLEES